MLKPWIIGIRAANVMSVEKQIKAGEPARNIRLKENTREFRT
jgi:hypothetical protein